MPQIPIEWKLEQEFFSDGDDDDDNLAFIYLFIYVSKENSSYLFPLC